MADEIRWLIGDGPAAASRQARQQACLGKAGPPAGWLAGLAALFLAFAAPGAPPNLVLILADDLGWADLGAMGSRFHETPVLDRLAAEGTRFNAFYTYPSTVSAQAGVLTGQAPPRHGMYADGSLAPGREDDRRLIPPANVTALPAGRRTLAEVLRDAGYETGFFGHWALGTEAARHPAQRGFDAALVAGGRHFNFQTSPPFKVAKGYYLADFLTDQAMRFVELNAERPFFLCVSHFALHPPHEAKEALYRKYQARPHAGGQHSAVYAAMIESVDQNVGRLLAHLDRFGLRENTLVVFASDNGGSGGYRSSEPEARRNGITDNAPLRGGQGQLYEGGLRAPLLVRWPGVVSAGRAVETPVTITDLFPTLLEAAGAAPPPDQPLDGLSLLPLLRGETDTLPREFLAWHFPGYAESLVRDRGWRATPAGAIRQGGWKLIEFFEDGRLELYDLAADLSETNNLAPTKPEVAAELKARLAAWRKSLQAVEAQRRSVR
ncbi:MAG: sulfatase [Limisphaerales bacterium]